MSIEVMKQAIEAFEELKREVTRDGTVSENWDAYYTKEYHALEALRKAVEQAEKQEPVAWISDSPTKGNGKQLYFSYEQAWKWSSNITPLYTAPPRKELIAEQAVREERGWCHQLVWDYGFSRADNEDVQEACATLAKRILVRGKK